MIQIVNRQFPNPGARTHTVLDARSPTGRLEMPVLETERRKSHIDLINPAHPLLPIATGCLSYDEGERLLAQELCHRLAALKEAPQYGKSVQEAQRTTTDGMSTQIRERRAAEVPRETEQLQQKSTKQIEKFQHEKDCIIETNKRQIQEKDRMIDTMERKLEQLTKQLQENEQVIADLKHKQLESEKTTQDLLAAKDQQIRELQQLTYDQQTDKLQVRGQSSREGPLCLSWRKCGTAPCVMRGPSSVVDGNMTYFPPAQSNSVYSYHSEKQMWSTLPSAITSISA